MRNKVGKETERHTYIYFFLFFPRKALFRVPQRDGVVSLTGFATTLDENIAESELKL